MKDKIKPDHIFNRKRNVQTRKQALVACGCCFITTPKYFDPCYSTTPLLLLSPYFSFLLSAAVMLTWLYGNDLGVGVGEEWSVTCLSEALLHRQDEPNKHWECRFLGFLIFSSGSACSLVECQSEINGLMMTLRVQLENGGMLKKLCIFSGLVLISFK